MQRTPSDNYDAREPVSATLKVGLLTRTVRKGLAEALDRGELVYRRDPYHKGDPDRIQPRVASRQGSEYLQGMLAKICPAASHPRTGPKWNMVGVENVYLFLRLVRPYSRRHFLALGSELSWMEGRWPILRSSYDRWQRVLVRADEEIDGLVTEASHGSS